MNRKKVNKLAARMALLCAGKDPSVIVSASTSMMLTLLLTLSRGNVAHAREGWEAINRDTLAAIDAYEQAEQATSDDDTETEGEWVQ